LAILERINPFVFLKQRGTVKISNYLDDRLIAFLDVSTRNEAIDELIDLLDSSGRLPDLVVFRKAILEREDLISTGIGMGVAVPHAKLKGFKDFFIVVGIQQKQGLEWDAIDKAPVRLIFLIGGPDDRQSEYLQILSQLTVAIKDQNLRKELMRAASSADVITAFADF
jgi:PTS system nitrogen regulatory IIA component